MNSIFFFMTYLLRSDILSLCVYSSVTYWILG